MTTGSLRISRSRGALSGIILVLLGIWGGLIAFVGPYFHYAYTPDKAWTYNTGRLWLEILPAVGAFVGGLILVVSKHRVGAMFGAWLAALSGAWFAVGPVLSPLWNNGVTATGAPVGSTTLIRTVEQIGFFTGLGVVIVFVAAAALGRLTAVRPAQVTVVPEPEPVPETTRASAVPEETTPASTVPEETTPTSTIATADTRRNS
ncbi:MAG: hypothetical protein JOY82_19190 [Streptosporangiaceae bacterium]|nr:hypothetical protein [Streptosporangiaceae bacterium]MBV9856611.1 hypothetical protein [Streptosporangiaceae bacterium]